MITSLKMSQLVREKRLASGNIQPVRDKGVGIDLVGVCGVLIVGNTFSEKGPPKTPG